MMVFVYPTPMLSGFGHVSTAGAYKQNTKKLFAAKMGTLFRKLYYSYDQQMYNY